MPNKNVRPNTDPTTGIPHGFVAGRHICDLICRIQDRGVNETYKYWKGEVERQVHNWLSDLDHPTAEAFKDAVAAAVAPWVSDGKGKQVAETLCDEHFDEESGTFDIEEIVEGCQEELREDMEFDEECYSLEADGITYELGWLGGGQLLRISKSPYMTYGTPCSPCIPGGVNCDLPLSANDGRLCYCPAPEDWPYKELDAIILKVGPNGETENWYEPTSG